MIPFPEVIDSTMIGVFRECPQRFFRTFMEHWKPKGESVHLHAGGAFAAGLERTRISYYEAGNSAEDSLSHGFRALMEAYGDFQPPEGSAKTLDRMLGALEFYFNQWPLERDGPSARPHQFSSGKYGIEFSFAEPIDYAHPITGNPIIYCGRSDMVADYAEGVYIADDKTTSQLGASWGRQWDLRSQFTGYCWAAPKIRIHVNGVLVRGVSILKTKYDKAEVLTSRAQWEIDRWERQLLRDIGRMEACWQMACLLEEEDAHNAWDYNLDHACANFGGCPYQTVCKSEQPSNWLPLYFERRSWNPLTREEKLLEPA